MSLHDVYREWLSKDLETNGQCTIFAEDFLSDLLIHNAITKDELTLVHKETLSNQKNLVLFLHILPSKNETALLLLAKILQRNKNRNLDNLLQISNRMNFKINLNQKVHYESPLVFAIPATIQFRNFFDNKLKKRYQMQHYLEEYYKIHCQYISQFWNDILPQHDMSECFVPVELFTNGGNKTGISINNYKDVFESKQFKKKRFKRIIIEADPGCGKSTYVNKVALDWANNDKYLRSLFSCLFVFDLKHFRNVEDDIQNFMPPKYCDYALARLLKQKNKVLIIFEGYDAMDPAHDSFKYVQSILNFKLYPFVTCIITTRSSHISQIPLIAREQRILITGFSPSSMDDFMTRQLCPLISDEQRTAIGTLLQIPLFCAIYCSIIRFSPDVILKSSYDLIQTLILSSTHLHINLRFRGDNNESQHYLTTYLESDCMEIGKYALSQLDNISQNIVRQIDDTFFLDSCQSDLKSVRLGLLIKKKCPTGQYQQFRDEYSFPHQLFAEYFAAYFVANKMGLTTVDTGCLSSGINQPFVQFLLRLLLSKWLNTTITDQNVASFLIEPKIFWNWALSVPDVSQPPRIYARLNLNSPEDKVSIIDGLSKRAFEVYMSEETISKWKPDWWFMIEKLAKTKVDNILIYFNVTSHLRMEILQKTLGEYLKSYISWNVCNLQNRTKNVLKLCSDDLKNISVPKVLFPKQIAFCSALTNCRNLEVMNLAKCNLSKEFLNCLLESIRSRNLIQLKHINLSDNDLSTVDCGIFSALSNCRSLRTIKMKRCSIQTNNIENLVEIIQRYCVPYLEYINFSYCEAIGGYHNFFTVLYQCHNLKKLKLENCMITQESGSTLLNAFSHISSSLESLNLSGNENVKDIEGFINALQVCTKLESVKLRSCLTTLSLDPLTEIISNGSQIGMKHLNVSNNQILSSHSGFFSALNKCTSLTKLDLSSMNISNISMKKIIEGLHANVFHMLQFLNISRNNEIGKTPNFFRAIGFCPKLKTLDVSYCNIIQSSLREFEKLLYNKEIESLENLNFGFNSNIGSDVSFFNTLQMCKRLTFVDFSGCAVTKVSKSNLILLEQSGCIVVCKDEIRTPAKTRTDVTTIVKSKGKEKARKKFCFVGDGAVGKTVLLVVMAHGEFPFGYIPTVFDNYSVELTVNNEQMNLDLFDTAGQEGWERIRPLAYPDTDVFLICFSIESSNSLQNCIDYWHKEIARCCPNTPYILVGCKSDTRDDPILIENAAERGRCLPSKKDGLKVAKEINASAYLECSGLRNEGVREVFEAAVLLSMQKQSRKKRFL